MRLVEEKSLAVIGVLLSLILILNLAQQYIASKQTANNQAQVRQSLKLVEAYGRVNAFSSEYIEMLNYDLLFSRKPGFWELKIKDVPVLLNKIPEADRNYWQGKTTRERFMFKTQNLNSELRKCQQVVNALHQNQIDYISKNQFWSYLETITQIIQVVLILLVIYLHAVLISSIQQRIKKPK
jgi:hypothetical protein